MSPRYRGRGMVLGRHAITFGTRKARVPVAKVLLAPEGPCPGRAPGGPPSGPKMAQNHQNRPPWGAPEGSVVQVDGQNPLGYCVGCLLAVFGPVWPRNNVRWAQNGFIWAPNVSCGLRPKNGRISGETDRIANPWTLFPRAKPHFRWFPPPQNGPNTHTLLPTVFAHQMPVQPHLGYFGLCMSTKRGSKMVKNESKMILNHLGCLWRCF